MAFANLYWNCIDQQLKDTELEDEREELSSIHIPKSHASPVFNNAKLSFLTFLTSMFESKVLYASPSNRTLPKTPRDFYMPNYEDLEIITKDKKVVHGWLIKRKDSRNVPTIIHFHGNACNVSHMLYDALGMFQKVKTNIMLVDYRGYGLSEGSPTQAGLIMDAEAALDYLLRRRDVVDPTSIFLFGRSLGGAVAIELAARRESAVRAVMVENTFTSIDDLVKHLSPAYSKHVIRAMSNKWNSQQVIPSISRPMLFLSGRADEIVPPWMMTSLYKAAVRSEGRELAAFPKGKHNSTCLSRGYYETIKRFVDRVLVPGPGPYKSTRNQMQTAVFLAQIVLKWRVSRRSSGSAVLCTCYANSGMDYAGSGTDYTSPMPSPVLTYRARVPGMEDGGVAELEAGEAAR